MKSVLDDLVFSIGTVCLKLKALIRQVGCSFIHRPFRVLSLTGAIAVMSGVDLYLTILYVTHTGMNEMNPLARAMMEYQSPVILAIWKTGTVAISVGILLLIRKQRSAELGAWIGCLVMGWLMIRWVGYIEISQGRDMEMVSSQNQAKPSLIIMTTSAAGDDGTGMTIID